MASSSSSSCKRALECEGDISNKHFKKSDSPNCSDDEGVDIEHLKKVVIDLTVSEGDDEQDDSEPMEPVIHDHYQCSSVNAYSFIQSFGVKRFLVHYDYILFPYCFTNADGKRDKPTENRVSSIIQGFRDDCSYQTVLENLKIFDSLLDQDTSTRKDMMAFAGQVLNACSSFRRKVKGNLSEESDSFMIDVERLMQKFKEGHDGEDLYRYVFTSFLRILTKGLSQIREVPNSVKCTLEFPMLGVKTEISGKPDIFILDGMNDSTVAVIECKRFKETMVLSGNTPIKDDKDIEKTMPSVRFCKAVNTAGESDDISKKESILERMYEDLDASICRCLKKQENDYFGIVFAQLVGKVLAWYRTCYHTTGHVPEEVAKKKSVRYGIGQIGFKIFFLTVGMNNSNMESPPHIRIGQGQGMGLDVFMTRPFDLMRADDRGKIRDIILAMVYMRKRFIYS